MQLTILPAGAWGTALAIHVCRLGHTVTIVPREPEVATAMASQRENDRYFPGFTLPPDLQIALEPGPALMEADVLVLACPSKFLRSTCREIRPLLKDATALQAVVVLCKGLEEGTNALPLDVVAEELPGLARGVLSGPTFASQIAAAQPSALVLATDLEAKDAAVLQETLSGETVRVYTTDDLIGVELGGCLKNVYAIAAGMCDGLGLRDNSKAALLTRALHEMVRVGEALGGRRETFYGLTGFGDLVLTCNGQESRNRTFGEALAQGTTADELINERGMTVEGYRTAICFHNLCAEKGVEAPILEQIYRILYEGQSMQDAIPALMGRDLKAERV